MDIRETNFIINRSPNDYGGKQADYITKTESAVNKALSLVNVALSEGKDLTKLFFDIFDFFRQNRHDLAVAHNTDEAPLFGRMRLHVDNDVHFTAMLGNYADFNQKMLAKIQRYLKGAIPVVGEPPKKELVFRESYKETKASFEIELLTGKDIQARQWDRTHHSDFPKMYKILDPIKFNKLKLVNIENFPPTAEEMVILDDYNKEQLKLKKELPNLHQFKKMHLMLEHLDGKFPSPTRVPGSSNANMKSLFILAKARVSIGGKMVALSEYLTWTYQDHENDPVDRMKCSTVVIIHMDKFLIDTLMQECAKQFVKAILFTKEEGRELLKDHISYFRYLFGHAMAVCRGSAAIGENFEKLMYKVHSIACRHNPKTLGDLEALTAPMWPTFRKGYDATIDLEPIQEKANG